MLKGFLELFRVKAPKPANQAVNGQDSQVFVIDQGHAGVIVSLIPPLGGMAFTALIAVGQGGFIAVVSVGNENRTFFHLLADGVNRTRLSKLPEAVFNPLLVPEVNGGRLAEGLLQGLIDYPRLIGIKGENLAQNISLTRGDTIIVP